jgi:methenyltetrahydrofolate cyclohydrolase
MEQGVAATDVAAFLDALASASPTPGGGAAAALAGALAAALVAMVCNLTIGRPRYAAQEAAMRDILAATERARRRLLDLADEDARAYAAVAAAYRLPRADEPQRGARTAAIQAALKDAVVPPLATLQVCHDLVPLCLQVAAHGNATVASDAAVAAELAVAGVRGAIWNVRANLAEIADAAFVARHEATIAAAEAGLQDDRDRVSAIVRAKLAPRTRP